MNWKKILKITIRVVVIIAGLIGLVNAITGYRAYQQPSALVGELIGIGLIVFLGFYFTRNKTKEF